MVKTDGRRRSDNVIDRRVNKSSGMSGWTMAGIGGGAAVGAGAISWGLGGVEAILCSLGLAACPVPDERKARLDEYSAIILADTETIWTEEFAARGETYTPAKMLLHDEQQSSICGVIPANQGPAYCKFDQTIYLDLRFFSERVAEEGVVGDFPPAFIIAHEVGHHVQNITGIFDNLFLGQLDNPELSPNVLSVRLELQADCFAGVWAKLADTKFGLLEPGDITEGIVTATVFGDDTQQQRIEGLINEAAFEHGSAEQRVRWFKRGFDGGTRESCDTWSIDEDAL